MRSTTPPSTVLGAVLAAAALAAAPGVLAGTSAALDLPQATNLSPAAYLVTVTNPGPGAGTISSNLPGLSCSTSCYGWYPLGTAITLSASADSGWEFGLWVGDCEGTGTCSFTVDGPKTVAGSFKPAGDPFAVIRHFIPGPQPGADVSNAQLVSDGTHVYGTRIAGGRLHGGSVFRAQGTTVETIHEFVGGTADGRIPEGLIVVASGNVYGLTAQGGSGDGGAIFKLGTAGTGFSLLHTPVGGLPDSQDTGTNGLVHGDGVLYGVSMHGGSQASGLLFRVRSNGTDYEDLHSFDPAAGAVKPVGALVLSGNVLLGVSIGNDGVGSAVFRINTDGSGFTVLHSFGASPGDGELPSGSLFLAGGVLYGLTSSGGEYGHGTVFRLDPDGSGYELIHSFSGAPADGDQPSGSLTMVAGSLVGATAKGGTANRGTVFTLGGDGSGFRILRSFAGGASDGASPAGGLASLGGFLYGITRGGGTFGDGTVYRVASDGTGYEVVHSFPAAVPDVEVPRDALVRVEDSIYGVGTRPYNYGVGTVYKLGVDGVGLRILHSWPRSPGALAQLPLFSVVVDGQYVFGTTTVLALGGTLYRVKTDGSAFEELHSFGSIPDDGAFLLGTLTLDGDTLYGTTAWGGGSSQRGTVFRINTDGSGYEILWRFDDAAGAYPGGNLVLDSGYLYGTTWGRGSGIIFRLRTDGSLWKVLHRLPGDGSNGIPWYRSLVRVGETLIGVSENGGTSDIGVVFSVSTDGSGFRELHSFAGAPTDGDRPWGSLIVDGGKLYGMTSFGGLHDNGTIYRMNLDGSDYQVLRSFAGGAADGAFPEGSLLAHNGVLYGMAGEGGLQNSGILFTLRHTLTLGGTVTGAGDPLAGVTLLGLPGNPTTDAAGRYTATVPLRWSGTVTPVLAGRGFTPSTRVYSDLQAELESENYVGTTCPALTIGPGSLPGAHLGETYTQTLTATGGTAPYSFAIASGVAPEGLTLETSSGVLSGTPLAVGTASFIVAATDAGGCAGARSYELPVASWLDPVTLDSDQVAPSLGSANLNGILEAGETIVASPRWRNSAAVPRAISSIASLYTGPADATYTLADSSADFGTIPVGATVSAYGASGDAFQLGLVANAERPAPHWDARFTETLSDGTVKTWTLHVGDSFADVARGHWAYRFIETIFHNRVTSGCNADPFNYCPGTTLTRAEMAVLVLMAKHGPDYVPPLSSGTVFTDVPIDHWAGDFIEQLAAEGITSGCGTGVYCPAAPITRAEMAVFLLMAEHGAGYVPPLSSGTVFTDVPIDHWAGDFIEQLAAEGITGGCAPSMYCPTGIVTRAEMAVFLTSTFDLQLND